MSKVTPINPNIDISKLSQQSPQAAFLRHQADLIESTMVHEDWEKTGITVIYSLHESIKYNTYRMNCGELNVVLDVTKSLNLRTLMEEKPNEK